VKRTEEQQGYKRRVVKRGKKKWRKRDIKGRI